MRRLTPCVIALLLLLLPATACGRSPGDDPAAEQPGPSPLPAVGTTRGTKVLTYESVTFLVPQTWRLQVRGGAAGLGDWAPRPGGRPSGPSLTVSTAASGPIEEAAPKRCEGGPAASVDVVEGGFAPVGERTAEFRLWIAACEDGTAEERRAWLLPAPRILFVEEYHVPENVEVVTAARVA